MMAINQVAGTAPFSARAINEGDQRAVNKPASQQQYDAQASYTSDIHSPFVMTCLLQSVAPGPHTFSVFFAKGAGPGETYLGFLRSTALLLVEEVDPTDRFALTVTVDTGQIAALSYVGVPSRTLNANVARPGLYKLTYSDTFNGGTHSSGGCSGSYRVGGATSPAINSMYSALSVPGNPPQERHRMINQVSLWTLETAGLYTFAVETESTCGSNWLGYKRGQSLLLLERIP